MNAKLGLYRKEKIYGFLFILPPLLGLLIFTLYPMIYSIYGSFTDWDGLGQMNFIGLGNFTDLWSDELFHKALFNTLFMMLGIPIGITLALLLALGLNRGCPGLPRSGSSIMFRSFLLWPQYRSCGTGPITVIMVSSTSSSICSESAGRTGWRINIRSSRR